MFQWSKKVVKSVTFNPGVADESLLDVVERHLEKEPDKTFSDLCKEALWQALCVPESVRPAPQLTATPAPKPPSSVEEHIADLERKFADLEERFFAKESNRLVTMEQHLTQLSQQVAQLAMMVNQGGAVVQPSTQSAVSEVLNNASVTAYEVNTPPEEEDPLISRLSELVDDF